MNESTELMRMAEVADLMRIKRTSLYRWIASGKFPPPLRFANRVVRYRRCDVEAWIEQHQPQPTAATQEIEA